MSGLPPINNELVSELRHKVLNAIDEQGTENFHPLDINKTRENDLWLWRFLVHQRQEISWAFDMIMECLKWRKEFGVNDIKESEFPAFFDEIGALYVFNKDRDGHRLVIMHVRRYRKEPLISHLTKRYFVYFMEKLDNEDPYNRISVLFDMLGAGYQNVDMDYLSFMFSCFKTYYPSAVARIYAFEMPWLFSAVWTVVKSWLNARATAKIKFVKKTTIQEFIDPDQLLAEFGGNNPYTRPTCDPPDPKNFVIMADGTFTMNGTPESTKKKVHFAENSSTEEEEPSIEVEDLNNSRQSTETTVSGTQKGKFLKINPYDELAFPAAENECSVTIVLTSNTINTVAFKVKTTSPAKYRVRPSVGIIRPGTSAEVLVTLLPGFPMSSLSSDKFLVIAMEVQNDHISLSELSTLWHTASKEQMMEHKIRCCVAVDANLPINDLNIKSPATSSLSTFSLIERVDKLLLQNAEIKRDVKGLRNAIYAIVLFQLFLVVVAIVVAFQYDLVSENIASKFTVDSCLKSSNIS